MIKNQHKALNLFITVTALLVLSALIVLAPLNAAADTTANTYYEEGIAAKRLGKVREAERNYLLALRKDTDHLASYLALADLYYVQHRYNDGIKILEQGIEKLQDAQLWAHKGMILNQMGNTQEAGVAYERALSIEPENEIILKRVSGYYLQIGNTTRAEAISDQLNELRARKLGVQINELTSSVNQGNQNKTVRIRVEDQGTQR